MFFTPSISIKWLSIAAAACYVAISMYVIHSKNETINELEQEITKKGIVVETLKESYGVVSNLLEKQNKAIDDLKSKQDEQLVLHANELKKLKAQVQVHKKKAADIMLHNYKAQHTCERMKELIDAYVP